MRRMYILSSYLVNPAIKSVSISPAEIEGYYRQHQNEFRVKNVRVWLITISRNNVKEGVYPPGKIKELFPNSTTSSIVIKKGDFREDIEKKLFAASQYELIGPLGSSGNYIYLYVVKPPGYTPLPIDSVRSKIISILRQEKEKEVINSLIEKVMENHFVERCFEVKNGEVDYNKWGSCGNRK